MDEPKLLRKDVIVLAGALMLIFARSASAYLDPGTGSFILQILLAGLVGAAFTVKVFWRSVKRFIFGLFSATASPERHDNK